MFRYWVFAGLPLFLLAACGDADSSSPGGGGKAGAAGADRSGAGGGSGGDRPDLPDAGEGGSGALEGSAGFGAAAGEDSAGAGGEPQNTGAKAFRWEVSIETPETECHPSGTAFEPTVRVYDRDGERLRDPTYEVTGDVDGSIETDDSGGFIVQGEGAYRITVSFTGAIDGGGELEPVTFDWVSDGSGPEITVAEPARGAMLTGSGDVEVLGQVTDAVSDLEVLTLNGADLLTAPAGRSRAIDATPPAAWGLNVIEIVATDACGHTTRHVQSHLQSEGYRANATSADAAARLTGGPLLLSLTQEGMDDPDSGGRIDIDDVATLVQNYLETNLYRLIGDAVDGLRVSDIPSCGGLGYDAVALPLTSSDVRGVEVTNLDLEAYGLSQNVTIEQVSVPLDVEAIVGVPVICTQVSYVAYPWFRASVAVDSQINLTQRSNGTVDATNRSTVVTLSNPGISGTDVSQVNDILAAVGLDITADIEEEIETVLEQVLPALVEGFLNELASFEAPPARLANGLHFVTGGEILAPSANELTQTFHAQSFPSSTATPYPALGSIVRPIQDPVLSSHAGSLIFAADDNLLNQGLWALWYGGGLEIPDMLSYPGAALRVSGLLPPVLMPADVPGEVRVGLGDLDVTLELVLAEGTLPDYAGPARIEAYVSYMLEGALAYDATRQQLVLTEPSGSAQFQIRRISDGSADINDPAARLQIETYGSDLIERVLSLLANGSLAAVFVPPKRLEFSEPIFGGTIEAADIHTNAMTRSADHVVFDTRFVAGLVPPDPDDTCFTTNRTWTLTDLALMGVPPAYWAFLDYDSGHGRADACPRPRKAADLTPKAFSNSVTQYRAQLDACEADSTFEPPACVPELQSPITYGWYCGAGRPLDPDGEGNDTLSGWSRPMLDAVDYCCCLHDQNLFDPYLKSFSPVNACGFAMCLRQAVAFPSESALVKTMPEVMRARQGMYDMATILCGTPATLGTLPPLTIASSSAECKADTVSP